MKKCSRLAVLASFRDFKNSPVCDIKAVLVLCDFDFDFDFDFTNVDWVSIIWSFGV